MIHIRLTIGSKEIDIDGLLDGEITPALKGEWCVKIIQKCPRFCPKL